MLVILKNHWHRIVQQKGNMIVYIVMSICALIVALYMSNQQVSYRIALLKEDVSYVQENSALQLQEVSEDVKESALLLQTYDAFIKHNDDGTWQIHSIKKDVFINQLQSILHQNTMPNMPMKGKGVTIIGYVMMFVMMQSSMYLMLFGEDKEQHMLERLQATPMSKISYMMATLLFACVATLLPVLLCISIANMLGFQIGLSLFTIAWILGLLSLFSVAIGFVVNAFVYRCDSANMVVSAIFVLSSILSGCFVKLGDEGTLLSTITSFLPQKRLLDVVQNLEQHSFSLTDSYSLLYIGGIIFILLFIGLWKCYRLFRCAK